MNLKFYAAALLTGVLVSVCAQNRSGNTKSVRYYEELVGSLAGQVRQLQDDNARLSGNVRELKAQVETLSRAHEAMSAELSEMRKKLAADSVKREKQLSMIAERLKTPQTSQAAEKAPSAPAKDKPSYTEYEEYIVQRGATLTAISKAYGVSVDAIKKANNKTSDVLRIGEKLKIPRK